MKKLSLRWTILVSIFLHTLFLILFLIQVHDKKSFSHDVEIVIVNNKEKEEKNSTAKFKPHLQQQNNKIVPNNLTIKNLMSWYDRKYIDSSKFGDIKQKNSSKMTANDVGRSIDVTQATEIYPSLQWLYETIDTRLSYPNELIMYERTGRVTIELDVDSNGIQYDSGITVTADDHVLKVYVLQVLDKSLNTPIPPTKKIPFPMRVKLIFDFLIISEGYYLEKPQKILKNNLNFIRSNTGSSWMQAWQKDQSKGVNLQLNSIYDDISTYLKKRKYKKMGIDILEKYKLDRRY